MAEKILEALELSKYYSVGSKQTVILDKVSLSFNKGEFVVIGGSSGSGKTTLLSILSGLDRPSSGNVIISGQDITVLSEDQLAPLRNRRTGFVFQAFYLIPSLNALENVMFPAELTGDSRAKEKAETLLETVGLTHRRNNFPSQLSGGEQQRVAICRALINEPQILFADEPTGNLDAENSDTIIKMLLEIHGNRKTTLVMATHSHSLAEQADRVVSLFDGRLHNQG